MHYPRERHMQAVDTILQYLMSSPGKWSFFRKRDTLTLKIYTYADYACSITGRKSTSQYVFWRKSSDLEKHKNRIEYLVPVQKLNFKPCSRHVKDFG